ncbi:tenascin [Pelmatolapia mariae]|uniref:tenascin n=1 Tax=Pelmatolapia mariae TaxID=158779 RepID=UPI002FE65148
MLPFIPRLLLFLLLAGPALLTPSTSKELQLRGQRTPRDTKQDSFKKPVKVVISEGCATQGDASDGSKGGKEIDLAPGSPLVLTHKIKLVPSDLASGSGSCGCDADFAPLRERLERLEREVSALRETCGGAEGNCCSSNESKGAGCSIKPETKECPSECSDQGRCEDGKCVCFPGFTGPDCSQSNCPGDCSNNGKCVNVQCVCDPGFTGPDCSLRSCPDNCNNQGRCVNGKCVCNSGFTGPSCSDESCPGNCKKRGVCVNGQCVCKPGFTGHDCSLRSCPDNCNNQGRCVNGKCVCNSGFTGPSCSDESCPGNCKKRGVCVNGQCVCNPGFTGHDCSLRSCPDNCNNQGRCVNGKCTCDSGFTGDDCSENTCPNNCNNRGRCVNGQCVCEDGFTGADCSVKGCPNNCNNRGRCFRGSCTCRRGFTGPDCSQCQEGMTGPNCDVVMSGVSRLSTQDITDTSVALVWTPPPVQYETYYITFTSQKESDQQITAQVEGGLTTYTQTGLAAGQDYRVGIVGEIDGRRGGESTAEFMTLISGPTNLRVVKMSSTSAVVQWEPTVGEIDRYRLTITPNDGAGRSQEMTIPADQNSAQIQQLEAGRLYDILLVAEKGTSRSAPETTQVVPGKILPRFPTAASPPYISKESTLTTQASLAPNQDVSSIHQDLNPSAEGQIFDQREKTEDVSKANSDVQDKDSSTPIIIARTKPLVNKMLSINGTSPKPIGKSILPRKQLHFNATRVVPRRRPFKKVLEKKNLKPGVPIIRQSVSDPSIEASSSDRVDKNKAMLPGTDSETKIQSSSEESTAAVDLKGPPHVGIAGHGNDTGLVSPEPSKYKNFVVTRKEAGKEEDTEPKEKEQDYQDSGKEGGREEEKKNHTPNRDTISRNVARSFRFEDLPPQTEYTLTLLGKGPGVLSRLHKLVISTGPEPPSNIVFSKVTENSVTVSWTKPKSNVSGFKVTYTHAEDGEPVSVSLDSKDSTVGLSKLSPGSSYEVTVISTLGLDESDPVKDFVMTLPDPPTHLRAVNVTDSTALLLWRPALAAVDKYSIVYGAGTGSEVKVTVSGNAAEQQLSGLEGSTTYTVTVTSQLGSQESSPATTSFTTTGGSGKVGEGPQDLQASNVTPRTATLSWKPPSKPVGNYRLSYQAKDKEMKEVIVDGSLTQYNLTRLHPGSTYTLQLQAEGGGQYTSAISTEFTTGTLRYPFPADCSQELLNGIMTSGEAEIFPQGRHGTPVTVSCDMETDGGGWTVFQRRKDGSENFFRRWNEYVEGFGDVNGEFWLGLASIHNLTAMSRMSLRVDLRDGDESVFARYSTFEVAKRNYKLTVGGYSGTAGDSLSYHNNRIFSTKDRDLAPFVTRCAMSYRGGWWYKNCHEANLNGLYGVNTKHQGVIWTAWKGKDFSIPFTEMKMRPAAFRPPSRG